MKLFFVFIFCIILVQSCQESGTYSYLNDDSISNKNGMVVDDSVNWIPKYILKDTLVYTGIDSKMNITKMLGEPILYNYYLGYDNYRFIWARHFHRLIILKLSKTSEGVYLSCSAVQKSDSLIKIFEERERKRAEKENVGVNPIRKNFDNGELIIDSVIKIDSKWNKIIFKAKELSLKEWNEVENLLVEANFWNVKPYDKHYGLDGARWTIEAHLRNKYWFQSKWSPEGKFKKVGEYLIKKSGLKEGEHL